MEKYATQARQQLPLEQMQYFGACDLWLSENASCELQIASLLYEIKMNQRLVSELRQKWKYIQCVKARW